MNFTELKLNPEKCAPGSLIIAQFLSISPRQMKSVLPASFETRCLTCLRDSGRVALPSSMRIQNGPKTRKIQL